MKIAEALVKIKDLKGKFAELTRVIYSDTTFELLDPKMEVPSIETQLGEMVSVSEEIARIKSCVAATNAKSGLTSKIHTMEHLRSCVSKMEELTHKKQSQIVLRTIDYGQPAMKIETRATYDVTAWTETINGFRTRIRELDLELQHLNWEVDLVE